MSAGLIEIPRYVAGTWAIDPAHSDVGFAIRVHCHRRDQPDGLRRQLQRPRPGGGVLLAEKVQIILEIEAALRPSPHAGDRD